MRPFVIAAILTSTVAAARAEEIPSTPDRALGLHDRWVDAPVSVDAVAIVGAETFGQILSGELDYAPVPWLYASALAGEDQGSLLVGGGLHARAIVGRRVALSIGGRLLHTDARSDTTNHPGLFGPTTIRDYSFDAARWATAEVAVEIRWQNGIQLKSFAGAERLLSGGAYTYTQSIINDGWLGDGHTTMSHGSGTPSDTKLFLGVAVGFSPHF